MIANDIKAVSVAHFFNIIPQSAFSGMKPFARINFQFQIA